MSISTIKAKLLIALNAMQTLKAAYDYEASNSNGNFPYATLTIDSGEGQFASTAHNRRIRNFKIRVYQEMNQAGQGVQTAESIAKDVMDELETHLDNNTTLSGTCKYAMPVRWRAMYLNRENDTRVLEAEVSAVDIVQVRTGP